MPIYEAQLTAPFASIFVPTADSQCYSWFARNALTARRPVLLTGPPGAGKTAAMQHCLRSMADGKLEAINVTLTAQTGANTVQNLIEAALDKKSGGGSGMTATLGSTLKGRRFVVFVDDLNMPARGAFGAQAPLELLRLLQVFHVQLTCTL